jgi:hypothetical protein
MPKTQETCPYCHRKMMVHRHAFSAGLARILLDITRLYGPGQPFHLQKDFSGWTHNQYANAQKLRYFGLIEKHRDFIGKRAGGYWRLTEKVLWLINCQEIPVWVRTFNNKVIEESPETTSLKGAVGYYDIPEKWARRARPLERCSDAGQEKFEFIKEMVTC